MAIGPAQIDIDVGLVANDGAGDALRVAFTSVQANFDALYARKFTGLVVAQATNKVLTEDLSWIIYTNEGATSEVVFTLPAAKQGIIFGFVVQDVDGLQLTAAAGDTIQFKGNVSGAGGKIDSATIGDCMLLVCINATEWVVLAVSGTWSTPV